MIHFSFLDKYEKTNQNQDHGLVECQSDKSSDFGLQAVIAPITLHDQLIVGYYFISYKL